MEGPDNGNHVWNTVVPRNAKTTIKEGKVLSEKIIAIDIEAKIVNPTNDGASIELVNKLLRTIPYYTWCNRGNLQMQVWLPGKIETIKMNDGEGNFKIN